MRYIAQIFREAYTKTMSWVYELRLWAESMSQIYRDTQVSKLVFEYIDASCVLN